MLSKILQVPFSF